MELAVAVHLTTRERAIVAGILAGCTNRELARRFGTSEQTVKNQITTLFTKVGVSSRLELALWAMRHPSGAGRLVLSSS